MPKRYRRVKTVARKAKWNSVMTYYDINIPQLAFNPDSSQFQANYVTVVSNGPTDAGVHSTTTHPVIKVRHLKAQVSIPIINALHWNRALIGFCYLPQGYTFNNQTIQYHPEWVMCSKPVFAQTGVVAVASVTSPLSRNLNSGDSIVFFCNRMNVSSDTEAQQQYLQPYISYVTRVN